MDFLPILLVFLVAGAAGTAVMIWAVKKSGARTEDLRALAQSRGWRFEDRSEGSVKSDVIFAEDWTLSVSFQNDHSGASSGMTKRWVEFYAPTPVTEGLCILGPELPAKTVQMAAGGGIMEQVTKTFVRGMGANLRGAAFVVETGGEPSGVVLSTPGAEQALDGAKGAPLLTAAREGRNQMLQPVVFLDENGLRVRVRSGLRTADDAARLIELGLDLRGRLKREG